MNKASEKVFAAEIEGRSYQSKAKIYKQLEAEGSVEELTEVLGGRFPVLITGWVLAHKGRIEYCEACPGEEET